MTATDFSAAAPTDRKAFILSNRGLMNAAAMVFVGSNLIWASGLALPAALAVLLGCCGLAYLLFSARARVANPLLDAPVCTWLLSSCLVIGFAVIVLGGEGHLVYTVDDWLTRDAVLADIVRHGWTAFYKVGGDAYYLRAPLGMYMFPGLVGHVLGLKAAHLALLTQNGFLVAVILYLAASLSTGRTMAYFLMLYGGFDILPWLGHLVYDSMRSGTWEFPKGGVQWWATYFQYTDHFTQICFVPNHAIPGWFFAILAVYTARRALDLATLGAVFAALIFWSPLSPLAAVPLLCYFAWRDRQLLLGSLRPWLGVAVGACFLPVAIFLVGGAGDIGHGSLLGIPGFWGIYFLFLLVELPHVIFLATLWPQVRAELKPLLIISVGMLVVLPLYSFGPGNDLTMRGGIAAQFLVAFIFIATLLTLRPEQKLARALGVAIVVIGAAKGFVALNIAVFERSFTISDCNLVTASAQLKSRGLPTNYINPISAAPAWLVRQPSTNETFETGGANWCWPDHPVYDSADKVRPEKGIPR